MDFFFPNQILYKQMTNNNINTPEITSELLDMRSPGSAVALAQTTDNNNNKKLFSNFKDSKQCLTRKRQKTERSLPEMELLREEHVTSCISSPSQILLYPSSLSSTVVTCQRITNYGVKM
ncbi:UNVERIFIED_CONTAM: hypothetical protein NCL1_50182 [Trichonephila clavipes]